MRPQITRSLLNQAAVAMSQNQNKRHREAERYICMYVCICNVHFWLHVASAVTSFERTSQAWLKANKKTNLALTKASKVSVSVEKKTVAKSRSATCIYVHASAVRCLCSIFSSTSCLTLATCCPHAIISQMSESAHKRVVHSPSLTLPRSLTVCLSVSLSHSLSC